jgi:hypothetical protein
MFMKKLLFFLMIFIFADSAYAYTDPYLCSKYYKLRIRNVEKVLAVGIRKVNNTSIETYVLGFGTPIHATINGAKLTDAYISKRRTLQCDGETIGHVRIYELAGLGIETGEFIIKSGDKKASTYLEID